MKLEPYVFITVVNYQSIVVIPDESHTAESWKEIKNKITETYISECIDGPYKSPHGRCEGVQKSLAFFERHATEWKYSYVKGNTICSWLLVE